MTDFHTHILPGMDDGSRDAAESLGLLRQLRDQGVTEAVLTPHYYAAQESPGQFLARRQTAWEALVPQLTEDLPRLHLGAEVKYFEGICAVPEVLDLRAVGSRYFLLEMPYDTWSRRTVEEVKALSRRPEIQVVLAHIERYLSRQDKTVLPELLEAGVLIQSNVDWFGCWLTRGKATRMLCREQIHLLGSDCHNLGNRAPRWNRLPAGAAELAQMRSMAMFREAEI